MSLKLDIDINYLKNECGIDQFIQGLKDTKIKYGCMQSMDQLPSDEFSKVNNTMLIKLKPYLPKSLISVKG